jgi:hypothetical protein
MTTEKAKYRTEIQQVSFQLCFELFCDPGAPRLSSYIDDVALPISDLLLDDDSSLWTGFPLVF